MSRRRGRGQIPPYGKDFRRVSLPWSPDLANRAYILKRDSSWFIRSDKTSEVWRIYHWNLDHDYDMATSLAPPLPTLTAAMAKLLVGVDQEFYRVKDFGSNTYAELVLDLRHAEDRDDQARRYELLFAIGQREDAKYGRKG